VCKAEPQIGALSLQNTFIPVPIIKIKIQIRIKIGIKKVIRPFTPDIRRSHM